MCANVSARVLYARVPTRFWRVCTAEELSELTISYLACDLA